MVDPVRGATIVAVASSHNPMRWRSTLAHELGHLIFRDQSNGKPGALSVGSVVERRAQSFARHMLIPLAGVRHFLERLNEPLEMKAFSDLVQRFQVSPAVAAIQLRDLGAINTPRYTAWSDIHTPTLSARFGWADQYTSLQAESNQRRAPQRLLARVITGYVAGLVSLETVASVRGVAPQDIAAELDEAGIKPTARMDEADEDDLLAGADPDVDLSWLEDI
ncbi:ImmA/IrrE family metallo-endopeptidase [Phytoactinopolyspora mesophila]|nr:ImmA/IrrE family metallo-endopeptidase [Phytoactinopolyspora mesophila]